MAPDMPDEFEVDPKPFGEPRDKPTTKTACRVTSLGAHPSVQGPEGFETVISISMETPDRNFEMCIDKRSARFLASVLSLYLAK